jgi:hypothetical protein
MRSLLFALAMLLAQPAVAATIVLDFQEETLGRRDDPFVSAECGCVEFSGSHGLRIYLTDEGETVLVAGADQEGGSLVIDFLVPVTAFALDFGGDSGAADVTSGTARLRGFVGAVEVALAEAEPNRNLLVDQTLAISPGVAMDRIVFTFSQLGELEPLSAYVDDVVLTTVPEPVTLGLFALGLAATATGRSRSAR